MVKDGPYRTAQRAATNIAHRVAVGMDGCPHQTQPDGLQQNSSLALYVAALQAAANGFCPFVPRALPRAKSVVALRADNDDGLHHVHRALPWAKSVVALRADNANVISHIFNGFNDGTHKTAQRAATNIAHRVAVGMDGCPHQTQPDGLQQNRSLALYVAALQAAANGFCPFVPSALPWAKSVMALRADNDDGLHHVHRDKSVVALRADNDGGLHRVHRDKSVVAPRAVYDHFDIF